MLAFFCAVGLAAHALDEVNGRPLGTRMSDRALRAIAALGLLAALAIGFAGAVVVSPTLVPLILAGGFLVPAYNLELFGGRFHTDWWFAAAWGAFPALTGWWVNALGVNSAREAIAGAAAVLGCFWLSVAQRRLSTPVRELRRRTVALEGEQRLADGTARRLDAAVLAAPLDGALRALSVAVPLLAAGFLAIRELGRQGLELRHRPQVARSARRSPRESAG